MCNIGPHEINRNWRYGWIGLSSSLLFILICFILPSSPLLRTLIFFPVLIGTLGFLQVIFHFCITLGFNGFFDFGITSSERQSVVHELRSQDRTQATLILMLGILITIAATLALYYFPFSP